MTILRDLTAYRSKRFKSERRRCREHIDYYKARAKEVEKEMKSCEANLKKETRRLTFIEKQNRVSTRQLAKKIREIEKLDFVTEVVLGKSAIAVYTTPITYRGVYLGPYRITIGQDEYGPNFRVTNLLMAKAKMPSSRWRHHMQQTDDGDLCLGSNSHDIIAEFRCLNLGVFIMAVWTLLNSYNPKDHYITLKRMGKNIERAQTTLKEKPKRKTKKKK